MAKKKIPKQSGWSYEISQRLPIIKFIGGFIVFTVLFYLITDSSWFLDIRAFFIAIYTNISSALLNIFGFQTKAEGSILTNSTFSVNVKEGCDALIPMIIYITAVLVFPADWKKKWRGLMVGIPILFVLNLLRIVSLYLIGIYIPSIFEFMHVEFWQVLFIICTVLTFVRWLKTTQISF